MRPKIKLLLLVLLSSIMLIFPNIILIAAVTASALAFLFARGLQQNYLGWAKQILIVLILIILLQTFTFAGLGFSIEGFYYGIIFAMRLLAIMTLVSIFVHTTGMSGMADAFGFLPRTISQVLVLALMLLPRFTQLRDDIMNAQKARGLSFRSPNIFRTYFPLLVPFFAKTLYSSEKMALAMEARGFEGG